jgi:hypothetical protein
MEWMPEHLGYIEKVTRDRILVSWDTGRDVWYPIDMLGKGMSFSPEGEIVDFDPLPLIARLKERNWEEVKSGTSYRHRFVKKDWWVNIDAFGNVKFNRGTLPRRKDDPVL